MSAASGGETGGSLAVSNTTPNGGDTIQVAGAGYAPQTEVTSCAFSDVVFLGSTTTDSSGRIAMSVTIPRDFVGTHELRAIGSNTAGGSHVNTITIRVRAAGTRSTTTTTTGIPRQLPVTGGNLAMDLWRAFAILSAGEILIGVSMLADRRRRDDD